MDESDFTSALNQINKAQKGAAKEEVPFIAVQDPYMHHSAEGKWKFINNNPNEGYKIHLNCDPVDAGAISRSLIARDLHHKYLSGGDVREGKVFTIYTGGRAQTEEIVRSLADNLRGVLKPPPVTTTGEVPYAHNIFGRFTGNKATFLTKIPVKGVSLLRDTEQLNPDEAFRRSDKVLREIYGDYYGGGITYYEPSPDNK